MGDQMRALESRFETAVALATEAGALAMQMRPAPRATLKGPQDWVTEADGAVERFLSERLAAAFPADGFQGEEGGIARGGSLRWVVDPIDGTVELHARPATLLCFARMPGRPHAADRRDRRAGPGRNLCRAPRRRRDAERHADPCSRNRRTGPAVVEVGWSHRRPNADFLTLCEKLLAQGARLRLGGSGALGLAEVAAGRIGRLCRVAHQSVGRGRGAGSARRSRRRGQPVPGRQRTDRRQPDPRLCARCRGRLSALSGYATR